MTNSKDHVLHRHWKQGGAEVLIGGEAVDLGGELSGGYYVAPTVLRGPMTCASSRRNLRPGGGYLTFKDYDDALSIANDTLFGLGAGVWYAMATSPTVPAAIFRPVACGSITTTPIRHMLPLVAIRCPGLVGKPT